MNISSVLSSTHLSNTSQYPVLNGTVVNRPFDLFKIVDILCVAFGLPANFYVIYLIAVGTVNGLVSEIYSLHLSVCEILLCVKSLLVLFYDSSSTLLTLIIFVQGLPITGRPLFQCLICFERYLAVVYPVTFLRFKPFRYKVMCTIGVWLATFSSSGIMILMFLLRIHINIYFAFILAQILFFLSIQLYCCLAVLRALKQAGPGERAKDKEEENHMKKRAFYLILITTLTMLVIYIPYIISVLLFVSPSKNPSLMFSLSIACFSLGGLLQPILFLYRVGRLNFINCQ